MRLVYMDENVHAESPGAYDVEHELLDHILGPTNSSEDRLKKRWQRVDTPLESGLVLTQVVCELYCCDEIHKCSYAQPDIETNLCGEDQ